MKISIFTSNQPRHISLINKLADKFEAVTAMVEVTTIFPGVAEDFYRKSSSMQNYFAKVLSAERDVFADFRFINSNVKVMPIKMGDINLLDVSKLTDLLDADIFVVFGSSYIKGDLCEILIGKKAVNIHMGVSPYYRGSGCNFWALYDGNPHMVGATLHFLSKGLDSGDIIGHALPSLKGQFNGFTLGMRAVLAAHDCLIEMIEDNRIVKGSVTKQDKSKEIRYSRYSDFNDEVVDCYMSNLESLSMSYLRKIEEKRDAHLYINPFYG
jgi:hypothetical protein